MKFQIQNEDEAQKFRLLLLMPLEKYIAPLTPEDITAISVPVPEWELSPQITAAAYPL
ncbi:hypothetical protein COLO4_34198 [Corchorus olitorius]|uniref:Uncharacterized protein n=1 Tax=Corchorus olitorius TaxID=93759 RepID=A0A1R3GN50_9ROSI|nr:hypothetical protein COLO4_34198 [Corchorus olitorius]